MKGEGYEGCEGRGFNEVNEVGEVSEVSEVNEERCCALCVVRTHLRVIRNGSPALKYNLNNLD